MQPLIVLAIVAVGAGAMSMGFLTNVIDLSMVQQFGVGAATIETPITNAYVDFVITPVPAVNGGVAVFKNVITKCNIQSSGDLLMGSKVICKLTDINSNVVIEGMTLLQNLVPAGNVIMVPINDPELTLNRVENIHDVIIVAVGPAQTGS